MGQLKHREESRVAMEHMLDLITQIADYICEHSSKIKCPSSLLACVNLANNCPIGQPFEGPLKKKIGEFKKEFARAKESLNRGVV